jgi:hypothetical protein
LTFEKQAKVVEQQGKLQQIAVQHQADMELEDKKLLTQLAVAEVATKYQNEADRESDRRALISQFHEQAHEQGMAAQQTQQQAALAEQSAGHQQDLQAQQAASTSQQSAQDAQQQHKLSQPNEKPHVIPGCCSISQA